VSARIHESSTRVHEFPARMHELPGTPENVHWGYFDRDLAPRLTVDSGDLVRIEALTHHAGDAPELLMDEGIERVFEEVQDRGPGPHLLSGPIAVAGARPGDVLQVEILAADARLPYGSNLAGHWGHLYEDFAKERVTIFELDLQAMLGRALFAYDWTTTPLVQRPGTIVAPGSVTREAALQGVHVPLRPHFGTIGLAPRKRVATHPSRPASTAATSTIGAHARAHMLYPVQVDGALLSVGDPHVSQGDGEVSGTALEASLTGVFRLTLRRDLEIHTPILETAGELLVHGFGEDLDEAMRAATRRTLELLGSRFSLSRDDAYAFASVAVDFTVTQVVDGRQGVHARIDKRCFPFWAS
jgi:acetamidase/formamidase